MKVKFTLIAHSFITFRKDRPAVMNKEGQEGAETRHFYKDDVIVTDDPKVAEFIREVGVGKFQESILMGDDADVDVTPTKEAVKENDESWLPTDKAKEGDDEPVLDMTEAEDDDDEAEETTSLPEGEEPPPVKKKKKKKKKRDGE